ncbi:RNA polymerase sigma factor SigZ [Teredinibacter franksiae]|uniref:RNA polymerase sigma factor SigZ n=1 Tax=Teredinibacter franksiae TaxID=2761453 RepID=UPI001625EC29|nr:RNA polymerase sigma factor SigZ [Teredinibacter franksiae]
MKLDEIWPSYRSSIKALLHSKVSDPDDVDDLLQEVLIKTHSNIGNLRKEESVKSWLFQITARTTIDYYRKKSRIHEIEAENLWFGESERNIKADISPCVEPFLKTLPEKTANLLRAIDLQGIPQKSYAQELGISYSTLKSQVQKARSELKDLYEDCCDYSVDTQGNLIDFEQKSKKCPKC